MIRMSVLTLSVLFVLSGLSFSEAAFASGYGDHIPGDSTNKGKGNARKNNNVDVWGVNGHPLNQEPYFGNIDLQLSLIKEAGMSYYRIDIAHDEKGVVSGEYLARFKTLIQKAAEQHITLIPVLFPPDSATLYGLPDTAAAYEAGRVLGNGFAKQYGRLFTYYELGNENDARVLKDPPGDGSDTAQYEHSRYVLLAGWFKGMIAGIKGMDEDAKFIISNSGWNRYAYFDVLKAEGVRFDIMGYHWYDGVEGLRSVLKKLRTDYADQTVWFTEINRRGGGSTGTRIQKREVCKELSLIRRAGKNIRGAFIYELFDQPHAAVSESSYGLFGWEHYHDSAKPKGMTTALQKIVFKK